MIDPDFKHCSWERASHLALSQTAYDPAVVASPKRASMAGSVQA